MQETSKIVADVYSTGGQEALNRYYENWASDYDADVVGRMGYKAPQQVADDLAGHLKDMSAAILDAGAGTGLVGEHLARLGYGTIDALDASQEMLDIAGSKGVYRNLICAELSGTPTEVPAGSYNAVICVGTFTFGHVYADALDELIRVLRPGGLLCFSHRIDVYEDPKTGFKIKQRDLEEAGAIELIFKSDTRQYLPDMDPSVVYRSWIYRTVAEG